VYDYEQYNYSAEADHQTYLRNRPKWLMCDSFINWADDQMIDEGWSPDMVVGYAKRHGLYSRDLIPCTSTLYHWIDRGIMRTKNIDLLDKVSRKLRNESPIHRENRRVLGPSIEERPKEVDSRQHFGHWEIDTLVGAKDKDDPVLLTLVERKTRYEITSKINQQDQLMLDRAMNDLCEQLGDHPENIIKTITSDNGSEFAGIYQLLTGITDVFFAHAYASYKRGTKENQHKLVRRFIPMGKRLKNVSTKKINRIEQWMNNIPRKILGYQTAKEAFLKELQLFVS